MVEILEFRVSEKNWCLISSRPSLRCRVGEEETVPDYLLGIQRAGCFYCTGKLVLAYRTYAEEMGIGAL
jgi:organic hydroperoxide reductase OsmC/OhrA